MVLRDSIDISKRIKITFRVRKLTTWRLRRAIFCRPRFRKRFVVEESRATEGRQKGWSAKYICPSARTSRNGLAQKFNAENLLPSETPTIRSSILNDLLVQHEAPFSADRAANFNILASSHHVISPRIHNIEQVRFSSL